MTLLESPTAPRRPTFDWNEERVDQLTRMWVEEEMSAGNIAAEFGITRSAILGKIDRLGLTGRECDLENRSKSAERREARKRMRADYLIARAQKPARPPRVALLCEGTVEILAAAPCALVDLDETKCHWPFGEPGAIDFHFCGGAVRYRSYCLGHAGVAYRRA